MQPQVCSNLFSVSSILPYTCWEELFDPRNRFSFWTLRSKWAYFFKRFLVPGEGPLVEKWLESLVAFIFSWGSWLHYGTFGVISAWCQLLVLCYSRPVLVLRSFSRSFLRISFIFTQSCLGLSRAGIFLKTRQDHSCSDIFFVCFFNHKCLSVTSSLWFMWCNSITSR